MNEIELLVFSYSIRIDFQDFLLAIRIARECLSGNELTGIHVKIKELRNFSY